eukprot:Plantae.Rhodophyta-Purpureofilum_apyrenoidigerum.ctg14331.p1 GENE.Plantae.Rhodophyta-Purpureofilum_apyrenoidigerum.ctg14331~~Plantae.Rhodophyta-Purpureofilum_apyrenoidigerum.ctg14331.p1  ORF type:complete len:289 (+),score=51.27 Plantae.Rhodophyta-Purpureofilum_apyrenoidigerum.ctg14331:245-1111(+)
MSGAVGLVMEEKIRQNGHRAFVQVTAAAKREHCRRQNACTRRDFLVAAVGGITLPLLQASGVLARQIEDFELLAERLRNKDLQQVRVDPHPSEPEVPSWLQGIWDVNAKVIATTGARATDLKLSSSSNTRIGSVIKYKIRFAEKRFDGGIFADWNFNLASTTDAYAGAKVVNSVEWTPLSTKATVLLNSSTRAKLIQILNAATTSTRDKEFILSELYRQLFVNPDSGGSPKATDFEVITYYKLESPQKIIAKQRIATYDNDTMMDIDKATRPAVLITDYSMVLTPSQL